MTFFLPIGRRSFLLSWRLVEALCVPVAFERVVWGADRGAECGARAEDGAWHAVGVRVEDGVRPICRLRGTVPGPKAALGDDKC